MHEQSKAARRRFSEGCFHTRYFVGDGIDIGGKPDPLAQYVGIFPAMSSVRIWDIEDGDAQFLSGIPDNSHDFLVSSHSLEHMVDVREALQNWLRVVKPEGFLIITVPDEDLYELGNWPSKFNPDHKWTFTIYKHDSWSPKSINILDLLIEFSSQIEVERVVLLNDFFREPLRKKGFDQTLTPVAECAIEVIFKKKKINRM
jgi:SAM-dependent methyltransferase